MKQLDKEMDAIDSLNMVLNRIASRLPFDYPDLYERYLKRWHPEDYEAYKRSQETQE